MEKSNCDLCPHTPEALNLQVFVSTITPPDEKDRSGMEKLGNVLEIESCRIYGTDDDKIMALDSNSNFLSINIDMFDEPPYIGMHFVIAKVEKEESHSWLIKCNGGDSIGKEESEAISNDIKLLLQDSIPAYIDEPRSRIRDDEREAMAQYGEVTEILPAVILEDGIRSSTIEIRIDSPDGVYVFSEMAGGCFRPTENAKKPEENMDVIYARVKAKDGEATSIIRPRTFPDIIITGENAKKLRRLLGEIREEEDGLLKKPDDSLD
jgi:hypothetical protein